MDKLNKFVTYSGWGLVGAFISIYIAITIGEKFISNIFDEIFFQDFTLILLMLCSGSSLIVGVVGGILFGVNDMKNRYKLLGLPSGFIASSILWIIFYILHGTIKSIY